MNSLQDNNNKSSRQRGGGIRTPDHKNKKIRVQKAEDDEDDALPIGKVLIRKGVRPIKRKAPISNTHIEIESKSDDSSLPNDSRVSRVSRFREGDMVWAKVKSHPWWPGQIFNPAFATATAKRSRRSGHVLVAFFGDATFGWFVEANLIPFEPTFREKSKQTVSKSFIEAVEDAVDELHRRAALGLMCNCRNSFNYGSAREGYVEVLVPGWEQSVVYPDRLVEEARDGFRPGQMVDFVKRMAVSPWSGEDRTVGGIKYAGEVRAYRAATAVPVSAKYREDLGFIQKRSEGLLEVYDVAVQQLPVSAKGIQREPVARFSVKDQNGHSEPTDGERMSIVEVQASEKEDTYLFKRRDVVNEKQYRAIGGSLMKGIKKFEIDQETTLLGDADEAGDVSNYLFKKRNQQVEGKAVDNKARRKKAEQGLRREPHGLEEVNKRKRETNDQTSHLDEAHAVENKEERKKAEQGLPREQHSIQEVKRRKRESTDQTSYRDKEAQTVDNKEGRKKAGEGFYREKHNLHEIKREKKITTDMTSHLERRNSADKHSLKRRISETEALKDCASNTDQEIPQRVRLKFDSDDSNKESFLIKSIGSSAPQIEATNKVPTLLPKKKYKKTVQVGAESEETAQIGQTEAFVGSLLNTEHETHDGVSNVSRKKDKAKNEASVKDSVGRSKVAGVIFNKSLPKVSSKKKSAKPVHIGKDLTGTVLHGKVAPSNILSEKAIEGGGEGITKDGTVHENHTADLGNSKWDAVEKDGNILCARLEEGVSTKSDQFEVDVSIGLRSVKETLADAGNLLYSNNGAQESEVTANEDIQNIDDSVTLMNNELQYDACHDSHLEAIHSNDGGNSRLEKKASCHNFKIPSIAEGQGIDNSLKLVSENTNENLLKLDDVIKGQIRSYDEGEASQVSETHYVDGHSVMFDVEKSSPGIKEDIDNVCLASETSTDVGHRLSNEINVVIGTALVSAGEVVEVVCQSPKLKPISDHIVGNKQEGFNRLVISASSGVKEPCSDNSQPMPSTVSKHAMNSLDKLAVGDVCTDIYDGNHDSHPDRRGEAKEDDQGCSSLPSGEDQGIECFARNVDSGFLLHQLLNDLRSIAIDPFYGIKWGGQVDLNRVFLRFRSLMYEKIQDLSYIADTSLNGLPSIGIETENENKENKAVERPLMSLSGYVEANGKDASDNAVIWSRSSEAEQGTAFNIQPVTKLSNDMNQTNEAGSQTNENKKRKLDARSADHSKSSKQAYSSPKKSSSKISAKRHSGISGRDSRESVRHKKRPSQSSDSRKTPEEPMALSMKFPQGFALPSEAQLKARFVRFGQLDISGTRIYCHTNCARVVFKSMSDAEAAFKYATKNSLFGQANVKFKLKQMFHPKEEAVTLQGGLESQNRGFETLQGSVEVPKEVKLSEEVPSPMPDVKFNMLDASIRDEPPQLPDIEMHDLCPLLPSDRPRIEETSDDPPSHEAYPSPLVQLKSCLKKPDESGNSNIKESTRVTFLLDKEHRHDIHDMKNGFSQIESCRDSVPLVSPSHHNAIAPDPPDISGQMMYLLKKCNETVGDIRSSIGYVPYHLFSSSS
ncbi:hypothetical protein KI387_038987 [Taxus chinensis]|uniref:PWWP domain-containing protein n=1 Tax=Taxus chinensis TaxID=29808 RepID=A0AA38CCZ0_TAXCH|nr:hypothetical protein KI387_038987 [Taxus chinensis]